MQNSESDGKVIHIKGNLLDPVKGWSTHALMHVTNCTAKSKKYCGLAEAVFNRFPGANSYNGRSKPGVPGTIEVHQGKSGPKIINLNGQYHGGKPGNGHVTINGECVMETAKHRLQWFENGLNTVLDLIKRKLLSVKSVALPNKAGCNIGGGNWHDYGRS